MAGEEKAVLACLKTSCQFPITCASLFDLQHCFIWIAYAFMLSICTIQFSHATYAIISFRVAHQSIASIQLDSSVLGFPAFHFLVGKEWKGIVLGRKRKEKD
jgi:hypothetical protein